MNLGEREYLLQSLHRGQRSFIFRDIMQSSSVGYVTERRSCERQKLGSHVPQASDPRLGLPNHRHRLLALGYTLRVLTTRQLVSYSTVGYHHDRTIPASYPAPERHHS
jgi:hypothetical protein